MGMSMAGNLLTHSTQMGRVRSRLLLPPGSYEGLQETEVGCQILSRKDCHSLSSPHARHCTGHGRGLASADLHKAGIIIRPFYRCDNRGSERRELSIVKGCWFLELNQGRFNYHEWQFCLKTGERHGEMASEMPTASETDTGTGRPSQRPREQWGLGEEEGKVVLCLAKPPTKE